MQKWAVLLDTVEISLLFHSSSMTALQYIVLCFLYISLLKQSGCSIVFYNTSVTTLFAHKYRSGQQWCLGVSTYSQDAGHKDAVHGDNEAPLLLHSRGLYNYEETEYITAHPVFQG